MRLRGRRAFWQVWTAQAVSVVGDGMHRAALLWWAASTRSAGAVAFLALCAMVPLIVLSPAAGSLADRHPRRRIMVGADVMRIGTSAALALAVLHEGTPLIVIGALTATAAAGEAMFTPAFTASLRQLLPPEELAAGNAMNLANSAAGGLVGPALGGALVAWVGAGDVLVLDAVTFLASALLVATAAIPPHPTRTEPGDTETAAERESGWQILRRLPEVRGLTALAAVLNLCTAPTSVLLVTLVVDRLHRDATVYGLLDACVAAGMLAGVALTSTLSSRQPRPAMLAGLTALGLSFVLVGLVAEPWWSATMFTITGLGLVLTNSFLLTRLQTIVTPDQQGRVFGVAGALANGLRPIGLAAAGPLVGAVGPALSYTICGTGMLAATVWYAARPRADRSVVAADARDVSRSRR